VCSEKLSRFSFSARGEGIDRWFSLPSVFCKPVSELHCSSSCPVLLEIFASVVFSFPFLSVYSWSSFLSLVCFLLSFLFLSCETNSYIRHVCLPRGLTLDSGSRQVGVKPSKHVTQETLCLNTYNSSHMGMVPRCRLISISPLHHCASAMSSRYFFIRYWISVIRFCVDLIELGAGTWSPPRRRSPLRLR